MDDEEFDFDREYECPACDNDSVTYFNPKYRVPRTLKCG